MTHAKIQLELETANQVCHISSLSAVISMQFVKYNETECRIRLVHIPFPKGHILLLHQTIVKHLEVRQQNIRDRIHN